MFVIIYISEEFKKVYESKALKINENFLGEPSFGSTGTPLIGNLPDGGKFFICTRWYTFRDGTEFINEGIKPDINGFRSIEDYEKNK